MSILASAAARTHLLVCGGASPPVGLDVEGPCRLRSADVARRGFPPTRARATMHKRDEGTCRYIISKCDVRATHIGVRETSPCQPHVPLFNVTGAGTAEFHWADRMPRIVRMNPLGRSQFALATDRPSRSRATSEVVRLRSTSSRSASSAPGVDLTNLVAARAADRNSPPCARAGNRQPRPPL